MNSGEYHAIVMLRFNVRIWVEKGIKKKVIAFHLRTLNSGQNSPLTLLTLVLRIANYISQQTILDPILYTGYTKH